METYVKTSDGKRITDKQNTTDEIVENNRRKPLTAKEIAGRVKELGFWFHNIHLGHGIYTNPEHPYGDFPGYKWQELSEYIPEDFSGKSVLDIGCNAGFYSIEMKKRGAKRVLGVDLDDYYLQQARFAADVINLDIEFRKIDVYDVDKLGEQFDYVLFLGVLYHLRYPMYALDKITLLARERLIIQSLTRGVPGEMDLSGDYAMDETDIFLDQRFPCMYFIENNYVHDASNWWIPNEAGLAAMLRSAGMNVVAHPNVETFICEPIANYNRWWMKTSQRD